MDFLNFIKCLYSIYYKCFAIIFVVKGRGIKNVIFEGEYANKYHIKKQYIKKKVDIKWTLKIDKAVGEVAKLGRL